MSTVFGLLAFALYIVAIIGAAAGITWVVVRFSPSKQTDAAQKS
ncbi:MAG TPA: hypothetical protein VHD91_05575 [Gaiellaceae bacterium]|nr:hypothetical protein [Gaiellaceae bacterium]